MAIVSIVMGFGFMPVGGGIGMGLGLFFVICGIFCFLPVFNLSEKRDKVNNLSQMQDRDYEKYLDGLKILKECYDSGIYNINDIEDENLRNNIQGVYDFCVYYKEKQEELEKAYQEKSNADFTTGASIAAGVALGSVLSSAISKHMNESHQKMMERMRKNMRRN